MNCVLLSVERARQNVPLPIAAVIRQGGDEILSSGENERVRFVVVMRQPLVGLAEELGIAEDQTHRSAIPPSAPRLFGPGQR